MMIAQKLFLGMAVIATGVVSKKTVQLPFTDDFKEGLNNWSTFGNGTWDSHRNLLEGRLGDNSTWLTVTPNRNDYTITTTATAINFPGVSSGIIFRASEDNKASFYSVGLNVNYVVIKIWKDGRAETLKRSDWAVRPGLEQSIRVEVSGSNINVFLNEQDKPLLEAHDKTYGEGGVGFFIEGQGHDEFAAFFRAISISGKADDGRWEI